MSEDNYFKKIDWSIEYIYNGDSYLTLPVLSIPVKIESKIKNNADISKKIKEAFFLLSQTCIGNELLVTAQEQDVKVICDDDAFKDEDEIKAMFWQGDIYIRSDDNLEDLALSLVHELMHVKQRKQDILKVAGVTLRLDRAIQREWAIEAEADAAMAQFALELSKKQPEAPLSAWTSNKVLDVLQNKDALSYLVTQAVSEDSIWNGHHMAIQFELFYSNPYLRREYAKRRLDDFVKLKLKESFEFNVFLYRNDITEKEISNAFNYLGKPYLSKHVPHMNLLSGRNAAMPKNIKEDIINFYSGGFRLSHIFQRQAVKKIETYRDEDIAPKIYIGKPKNNKI